MHLEHQHYSFLSKLNIHYYDIYFADYARVGIIFTHILNNNRKGAQNYLNSQKGKFISEEKFVEAKLLLSDTETGLKLAHYYQLYK